MSNFDATALQRQLINLKSNDGSPYLAATDPGTGQSNVDGVFGTITQAALIKYQTEHSLTPSGQPDAPTMQSLGLAPQPPAVVKWSLPTFSIPAFASDYILNYLTSKIAWASTAGAVLILAVLNGLLAHIGIQLDGQATTAVAGVITVLLNGIVIPILRVFFNRPKVVDGKVALKA